MHKENWWFNYIGIVWKELERELIKCLECLGLDLTGGDGMAWWMDGRHYATKGANIKKNSSELGMGLGYKLDFKDFHQAAIQKLLSSSVSL